MANYYGWILFAEIISQYITTFHVVSLSVPQYTSTILSMSQNLHNILIDYTGMAVDYIVYIQ